MARDKLCFPIIAAVIRSHSLVIESQYFTTEGLNLLKKFGMTHVSVISKSIRLRQFRCLGLKAIVPNRCKKWFQRVWYQTSEVFGPVISN
jgi:hypothetical protein